MGINAGACRKTPANIHGRNSHILPGQSHYEDHRHPDNAVLSAEIDAKKSKVSLNVLFKTAEIT